MDPDDIAAPEPDATDDTALGADDTAPGADDTAPQQSAAANSSPAQSNAPKPKAGADDDDEDEKKEVKFEDEVEKKAKKSVVGKSAGELSGAAGTMMKMAASFQETFSDLQDASMGAVKAGFGALGQKASDAYQAYKMSKLPDPTTDPASAMTQDGADEADQLNASTSPSGGQQEAPQMDESATEGLSATM
ncbi:hypothetical protein [Legionella oakridgensis]|uniref:Uncharacterized protein n=2 Tax=Legionella oakridgensis TaxID=29423 RepID=W0BCT5_9GAMM|nr:hypothetical protein [Legionella oakridgensis]AHE68313.1 hypothetical protein Loa_02783 [Legionella oakridgensis ATCC 33761 = DSM 21215]KTD39011.1 hypothetical protein Loak_1132 [Legionella oakridgensis]STY21261.1 Uncharacterised protein [Legionella longbeachae]